MVSAAPELEGGLEFGRELKRRGIVASIAHKNATYQDVLAAIEAGYTQVTHMYSGTSGLKRINAYRISGVIESTLLLDELTTEIIGAMMGGKPYERVRSKYSDEEWRLF